MAAVLNRPLAAEATRSSTVRDAGPQHEQAASHVQTDLSTPFKTVTELIRARAAAFPDVPVIGVPGSDLQVREYTYSQIDNASSFLARNYASRNLIKARAPGDTTTKSVVGILSPSGFEYALHELAVPKLGHALLMLSTSIPPQAIASLIQSTGAAWMIVHSSLMEEAKQSIEILRAARYDIRVVEQLPSGLHDGNDLSKEPAWRMMITPDEMSPLPAYIVHSSGSTGMPKPIAVTHKATCYNCSLNFGMRGLTTLPLFHNHGHSCYQRALHSTKLLYLFPSELPLTTANVLGVLRHTENVEALFIVPYVLKLLAESEEGLEMLRSFKLVTYGGAACPDELGDKVVKEGVRLVGHYGATEVSQLMTSFRDFDTDKAWNYVRASGPGTKDVKKFLHLNPQPDGTFEMIVKPGWPGKVMSNMPDGSFTTKDLFVPHPTIPDAYKFVGRLDDTLVLYTGEKVNPVPMELLIKGSSIHVSEAVVFGQGYSNTGVLLLPTELARDMTPEQLFPLVWPHIAAANAAAPPYAAILPEMVIFLPFDIVLPRADKGSFIRAKVYAKFEELIATTYAKFEAGELHPGGIAQPRRKLHGSQMLAFVKTTLASVVVGLDVEAVAADEDLFSLGVNSLQAARMRAVFQRDLELGGRKLPTNVVFENPTIERLTAYLEQCQRGEGESSTDREAQQERLMLEYVERYSDFHASAVSQTNPTTGRNDHVVLLTGASGSLGAHILAELLKVPSISKVYALVRASGRAEALGRIQESLKLRGLSALGPEDFSKVICLPSSLGHERLGLSPLDYEEIRAQVTAVIHNAWAVNFNMGVESFEKDHIRGAYNLLHMCATAGNGPAAFYFSSSVSAVARAPGPLVPERVLDDPEVAQPMGYARSKWVVENICRAAAEKYRLPAEVLRIGQMVGDTSRGIWNESEAISLIIKSAQTLGCLPDLQQERLSWLPVDRAAQGIVEVVLRSGAGQMPSRTSQVWHILNPQTTTWAEVHQGLRDAGIRFEVVPVGVWLDRLERSSTNVQKNPTYKLLDFFQSKYATKSSVSSVAGPESASTSGKRASHDTTETLKAASALRAVPPVRELVTLFVRAWQSSGFLQ